ncbi:MAG: hypothetical protein ACI9FJ_000875 [Alteromonadaceae bacterium]|jgi:hypothetical protein
MPTDIYKTPDAQITPEVPDNEEAYYVVSGKKFLVLFISTLGIYKVYWFYKQWQLYRDHYSSKVWPVPRAIFSIFFTHQLFREVEHSLGEKQLKYSWNPASIATLYVVFTIVESITSRLSQKEIGEPITDIISTLVLPIIAWSLYEGQLAMNLACGDPQGHSNSQFTPLNYLWILLGSVVWLLVLVGLYDVIWGFNW